MTIQLIINSSCGRNIECMRIFDVSGAEWE